MVLLQASPLRRIDVREHLADLLEVHRALDEELRRLAAFDDSGDLRRVTTVLARTKAILAQGLEELAAPPIRERGTICWLCEEEVVPGHVATSNDLYEHMNVCAHRRFDRRGDTGRPRR